LYRDLADVYQAPQYAPQVFLNLRQYTLQKNSVADVIKTEPAHDDDQSNLPQLIQ
jgi:hypothetical protein